MNDGQIGIFMSDGLQDRIGNRVISAQRDRPLACAHQFSDRALDLGKVLARRSPRIAQMQVPGIGKSIRRAQIDSQLRPLVGGIALQSLADLRRSSCRPTQIRRIHIQRNSNESWHLFAPVT